MSRTKSVKNHVREHWFTLLSILILVMMITSMFFLSIKKIEAQAINATQAEIATNKLIYANQYQQIEDTYNLIAQQQVDYQNELAAEAAAAAAAEAAAEAQAEAAAEAALLASTGQSSAPSGSNIVCQQNAEIGYYDYTIGHATSGENYTINDQGLLIEDGTNAVLVAMGSDYKMGGYYYVQLSDGTGYKVKKVDTISTTNGCANDTSNIIVEPIVDSNLFDPSNQGTSGQNGVYVTEIISF